MNDIELRVSVAVAEVPAAVSICIPDPTRSPSVRQRSIFALVVVGIALHGCSATGGLARPGPSRTGAAEAPHRILDARELALADASCFGGLPVDSNPGPTELIIRQGYVLEHSSADKIPLWVCESVDADQLTGHLARHSQFKADPELKGAKSNPGDYRGSGYDRGHQAPAGNQTKDPALKDQTFFMSNIAPQRPSLNRGIWKMLENKTRAWASRYGHAYEWTGPIRCESETQAPAIERDACLRQTIGPDAVAVPPYFYKIIIVRDGLKWKSLAFVMPNADFHRPYRLEPYIRSIDWIERRTGIEFMPNIAPDERRALKTNEGPLWP